MNAQASRKLIVVGAMAVVVAIGVITFAMRPHAAAYVAQTVTPPVPLAESKAVEDVVVPAPEAPATLAPVAPAASIVAAPAKPAHQGIVAMKHATVRMPAESVKSTDTVKPTEVATDLSMTASAAAVASSSEPGQNAAPTMAAEQNPDASATVAAGDGEITANVKSAIVVDSPGKGAAIGVTTTNGVVALTGSLASQDEIDHIKLIVAAVKDVKSVDASALSVPAT